MAVVMFCYPKCSTCKKAENWLNNKNISYCYKNIVQDNPTVEELEKFHRLSGLPLKRFFNTSGIKYRELDLKNKLPEMTEEQQLELLSTDGMLVKRPILIKGDHVLLGFKINEWENLFD